MWMPAMAERLRARLKVFSFFSFHPPFLCFPSPQTLEWPEVASRGKVREVDLGKKREIDTPPPSCLSPAESHHQGRGLLASLGRN